MKKKYFSPGTTIVRVSLQNMIASSPLNINGDSGTATLNEEELDEGDVVLTRRRHKSVWDDAEEEMLEEEEYF